MVTMKTQLNRLQCPQLKEYLKEQGLPLYNRKTGGQKNKKQMIDALVKAGFKIPSKSTDTIPPKITDTNQKDTDTNDNVLRNVHPPNARQRIRNLEQEQEEKEDMDVDSDPEELQGNSGNGDDFPIFPSIEPQVSQNVCNTDWKVDESRIHLDVCLQSFQMELGKSKVQYELRNKKDKLCAELGPLINEVLNKYTRFQSDSTSVSMTCVTTQRRTQNVRTIPSGNTAKIRQAKTNQIVSIYNSLQRTAKDWNNTGILYTVDMNALRKSGGKTKFKMFLFGELSRLNEEEEAVEEQVTEATGLIKDILTQVVECEAEVERQKEIENQERDQKLHTAQYYLQLETDLEENYNNRGNPENLSPEEYKAELARIKSLLRKTLLPQQL